ncbi:MAG TPA: glycoside hydrolase family 38 C-terminal domain-containing protein, partial [Galbitalea sp.]
TQVDWHAKHKMLRAQFHPARYGDTALSEIQFGHIARVTTENDSIETAQFETCAHKWIATQDDRGGFALLNDSKYGHRAKNGLISLNLLRSPTFPDKTADRGANHFVYAITPFATDDLAKVIREGYRLNNPLLVEPGATFGSVASTTDPGVIIETLKTAENGKGTILRLYESLGRNTSTALTTNLPHKKAFFTDLLENKLGPADLGSIEFTPFEITTILLEP